MYKLPLTLSIKQDEDPQNPRQEYDHLGTMVCWHRRYGLGDEQPKASPKEYQRSLANDAVNFDCHSEYVPEIHIKRAIERHYTLLPLYLYDHSGLSISTGAFSCAWDSGQVGFIYLSLKDALKEFNLKEGRWETLVSHRADHKPRTLRSWAIDVLRAEVQEYDNYLQGEVYGFEITDAEGEHVDSCWGFYDENHIRQEAESVRQYWIGIISKADQEQQMAECRP
jgi:hypothetical protein